jgi:mannosyltransferase
LPRRVPRSAAALAAITLVAGVLRFAALGHKSFWLDEAYTVEIVRHSFSGVLHGVWRTESTPPLYYLLAWLWTHVFGTSEAGIRSFSALVSTATVPLVYLAGRELGSRGIGLGAALFIACNPFAVWYAQEARAYALLLMLVALGLWCFARALRNPSPSWVGYWAAASVAALATHYFAALPIGVEACWLLHAHRRRRSLSVAIGVVGVAGLALLPLLLHQSHAGHTGYLASLGLTRRLVGVPGGLLLGDDRPGGAAVTAVACVLAGGALWLAVRRPSAPARRAVLVAGSLAVVAVAVPVVAAFFGVDYVLERYLIGAEAGLAVLLGAGFAASRTGWLLGALLAVFSIGVIAANVDRPKYGALDYRDVARAVGHPAGPAVLVATPGGPAKPLEIYAHGRTVRRGVRALPVAEIDAVGKTGRGSVAPPSAPAGFRLVEERRGSGFTLVRWRTRAATLVSTTALTRTALGRSSVRVLVLPR